MLSNLPRAGHDYKHLTRPQADILIDESGRFVPDYVLRYKSIAEDYARLCRILGKKDSILPVMNRPEHLGYETYFADSAAIEMVADLFWRDIELFGYQFGVSAMNPAPALTVMNLTASSGIIHSRGSEPTAN